ncbi:MAG: ABC transporter permease, partial [Bacteroidota bacterium]
KAFLKKLWTLSRLEFSNVVRASSFKVIIGIILLMATLQNLLWNDSVYIGNTVALTSNMTLFRLSFGVFIMILLMVWSGELFFKDKTVKIWQITDALPVPVWVTQLSKFITMMGVSFLMAFSFLVIGVIAQVLKGGAQWIDFPLYVYDLLGFNWGWLTYVLQIALVFFIAGLTGSRFLTHIISVGILFGTIMAFELGLAEQTIYAYGAVPGLEDYSEMSEYGIWYTSAPWYFLMWVLLATVFLFLGVLFWQRGTGQAWYQKFLFTGNQLNWVAKVIALIALVGFVMVRAKIDEEVVGKGNFVSSAVEDADAADYEKTYSYLKEEVHPKYHEVNLSFDYYPEERKATYQAEVQLITKDTLGVETLHLNFPSFLTIDQFETEDGQALALKEYDERHDMFIYNIPKSEVNDTLNLVLRVSKQYEGFTQSGENPQADMAAQGAFGSIRDFMPFIGYKEDKALDENRKREDHGLSKLTSRMADINDPLASKELLSSPDAYLVSGTIKMSTSENQLPLGPGKLVKSWADKGRNYAEYQVNKPSTFDWHLGSFETQPVRGQINDFGYSIWASTKHPFNLDIYKSALTSSYEFIRKELGTFPYGEVRLVEIPYYHDKFLAFPNTIAISEKEGWYADTTGLAEKAYIHQTVASQMTKLWLNHQVKVANVQGADMLAVALPEALALSYIKDVLGQEAAELIIKKKNDLYNKDRYNEPNQEPPLLYADGTDYLEENKGAVELYRLIDEIGRREFVTALKAWTNSSNEMQIFASLYEKIFDDLPDEFQKKSGWLVTSGKQ